VTTILNLGLYALLPQLARERGIECYLEIGVNEGKSAIEVLEAAKDTLSRVILCDNWCGYYGGSGKGNHNHLVSKFGGYKAKIEWLDGDSKVEIPKLGKTPFLDMALVDGDHSAEGCRIDMENVFPLVRPGGIMVVDDLIHPAHPHLQSVFDDFCASHQVAVMRKPGVGVVEKL
jgi:predicted O-methyltransferase YrrM